MKNEKKTRKSIIKQKNNCKYRTDFFDTRNSENKKQ